MALEIIGLVMACTSFPYLVNSIQLSIETSVSSKVVEHAPYERLTVERVCGLVEGTGLCKEIQDYHATLQIQQNLGHK